MFTGIVETIGTVQTLESHDDTEGGGGGTSMTITDCADILTDARLGDSISINGTCLTITALTPSTAPYKSFKVGISPETLRRTNLSSLVTNSKCNLERAVSASTRMGGHFVQGHVDTTATILNVTPDENSLVFRLSPRDKGVLKYIVEKGYVGLDGASLTVTKVVDAAPISIDIASTTGTPSTGAKPEEESGYFEIMLIAYTQERIVTASKKPGEDVNVEVDMVGKYVEKSVQQYFEGLGSEGGVGGGTGGALETMMGRIAEQKIIVFVDAFKQALQGKSTRSAGPTTGVGTGVGAV
ncbi:MAG: Riboflavin synthase alpha chain [Icmadophila ericetorum]|nr:Riboflavin synthase alpha chain [Icmadophila ericetorum]